MTDLAQRIAALAPEKLALLERRLSERLGRAGNATLPPAGGSGGNGDSRPTDADAESTDRAAGLKPNDGDTAAGIPLNGNHHGRSLPEVDRFSDEDVNLFLTHLNTAESAAESPSGVRPAPDAAAPDQASPEAYDASTITRIGRGEQYDLLTNIDQLFDEEVDAFITNMFTEREIADALSALRAPTPALNHRAPAAARTPAADDSRTRSTSGEYRAEGLASTFTAGADVARLFEQAYLAYARLLQEVGLESQWKAAEAHHAYAWDTREILMQGGDQDLHDEAAQNYARSLEEARAESRRRFEDAYLNYLEEIREVWLQLDAATVGPDSLAAVGRGMAMAANLAAETIDGSSA